METEATAPDSVSVAPSVAASAVTPVVTVSPFDSISAQHSTLIYRQFVQGKVMTKLLYNDIKAVMVENPLFTVLFNHQA
ncbi:MAG: hypothetical protein MJK04_13765, partial [Psychrosphaera sp.]|nr:hypothetical protein [Psychrosphaera sp.]